MFPLHHLRAGVRGVRAGSAPVRDSLHTSYNLINLQRKVTPSLCLELPKIRGEISRLIHLVLGSILGFSFRWRIYW